jgi:hypothetical protein
MGVVSVIAALASPVIGTPTTLPVSVIARYPELSRARWRRGGLFVRIGGWCLGQSTVSAITLWHTIWLAPNLDPTPELLLHELRHVDQFDCIAAFPIWYLWESLRHGYVRNRFEADARAYASQRVREA